MAIIGASGFIGRSLHKQLAKKYTVTGTCYPREISGLYFLDITQATEVNKFIHKTSPDIVIHLAAITDLDLCERNKKLATDTHVLGTQNLVNTCQNKSIKFVYFSTDNVFDGKKGNYNEKDIPNPINVYGKTKLAGEQEVQKLKNAIILRTSMPFGIESNGKFINGTIEKLKNKQLVTAFTDMIRSPTEMSDLTQAVHTLIESDFSGIIHCVGSSKLSMYDAALEIAEVFGCEKNLIHKSKSTDLQLDAVRPYDTSLNNSLAKKNGLKFCTFKEGLIKLKKQMTN